MAMLAGALAVALRSLWAAVGVHAGHHLVTYLTDRAGLGETVYFWAVSGVCLTVVGWLILRRWSRLVADQSDSLSSAEARSAG